MRFLIDDANVEKIKEIYTYYPVDGVTTNPSILAKSKRQPYDVLQEIRELIGPDADLHVQAVSRKHLSRRPPTMKRTFRRQNALPH